MPYMDSKQLLHAHAAAFLHAWDSPLIDAAHCKDTFPWTVVPVFSQLPEMH